MGLIQILIPWPYSTPYCWSASYHGVAFQKGTASVRTGNLYLGNGTQPLTYHQLMMSHVDYMGRGFHICNISSVLSVQVPALH